ncbi:hypoxanthine-guanine phosphoribosyltransferase [Candidatus Parabeggiatoa sp. HSG14]|uniref:hypoxanthine-guanine phosphoribosyltransferase n=1 Tax=Candidatus Parabeggiatoa sp. HSG14 TaxID=3055593 RepID=UPI0025A90DDA|nr:hypoxanthine-guanine phosphoribosyltransferase [Thiotrichales bacterium HSG14]
MKNQLSIEEIQNILAKADQLHTDQEVSKAFDKMATAINQRLQKKHPLCLSVMLGGLVPAGQLLPRLNLPLEVDYIHATRYREATSGSDLHWVKYPSTNLKGRVVLVIDDILDEGLTLKAIVKYCQEAGAQEVLTAVLVEKQLNNRPGLQKADFTGLTIPNRYVFGYGMDYQGQLRYAPGIYAVHGL